MPNWTTNYVTFEGSKEKIIELKELFASDERVFDFNKILPMPEESDDFKKDGSLNAEDMDKGNNWYVWSIKSWGTKWNAVDSHLDVDNEERLEYSFRTAWDAPRGVIQEIYDNRDKIIKGLTYAQWTCFHEFEEHEDMIFEYKKKDDQ